MPKKIIRITTVPLALRNLLRGQMKYMQDHGFEVIMISANGPGLPEVIANEQCRHIIVPMTRKITPFRDLLCLWKLFLLIRKEKPDIVHTHTPKAGLLGMLAAALCGIQIRIHTVAGLPLMTEHGFKFRLLRGIEKITYMAANYVWPNSQSLYGYIIENKLVAQKKVKVIGKGSSNGIDLSRFDPEQLDPDLQKQIGLEIQYNPANFYLLFIGRLVADKGITELVNAFTKVKADYANARLILVGTYEQELDPLPQNVINQIDNDPAIIHIDWTEQGAYYMQLSDCFVFPSHREGFPNVVLQAGAMHLPIIGSRIFGNIDIITDKESGLLFDKSDEEMLVQKIIYAYDHPEQMKLMAENLYKRVVSEYPQPKVWELIREEYLEMLKTMEG